MAVSLLLFNPPAQLTFIAFLTEPEKDDGDVHSTHDIAWKGRS